jgi:O2-independent ubiquinone biosynthesis accessory factor UbiT
MLQLICRDICQHGPSLLKVPLRCLPHRLQGPMVEQLLNRVLAEPLQRGNLDFLDGTRLQVVVPDLDYRLTLTLDGGRLCSLPAQAADVIIRGKLQDLIRLSTGEQDPDTLFFQRRLLITGDTELGLACKNMLDGLDSASQPAWFRRLLVLMAGIQRRADMVPQAKAGHCEDNT